MKKSFKPGQAIEKSGIYEIIGPRGGDTGKQITGVKGKVFPPQPKGGETYILAEKTKHKRGK